MKPYLVIYKMYNERISPLGFSRLKTTWWQRKQGKILQIIHIHKFSSMDNFRVHATIHLAGFNEDVHWLNGISSHNGWYELRFLGFSLRRYSFSYTESQSSWHLSADSLFEFTNEVLLPWFEKWMDIRLLRKDPNSPLDERQKAFLTSA